MVFHNTFIHIWQSNVSGCVITMKYYELDPLNTIGLSKHQVTEHMIEHCHRGRLFTPVETLSETQHTDFETEPTNVNLL